MRSTRDSRYALMKGFDQAAQIKSCSGRNPPRGTVRQRSGVRSLSCLLRFLSRSTADLTRFYGPAASSILPPCIVSFAKSEDAWCSAYGLHSNYTACFLPVDRLPRPLVNRATTDESPDTAWTAGIAAGRRIAAAIQSCFRRAAPAAIRARFPGNRL